MRNEPSAGEPRAARLFRVTFHGAFSIGPSWCGTTLEDALAQGLAQIARNGYAAELRAAGAQPIDAMAVAFDGKTVRVQTAPPG